MMSSPMSGRMAAAAAAMPISLPAAMPTSVPAAVPTSVPAAAIGKQ